MIPDSYKFKLFWPNGFLGKFLKVFTVYSYVKIWPQPTTSDHHFDKPESILCEDALTRMWTFLAKWFSWGSFQKIYSIYSYVKIWPTIVAPPYQCLLPGIMIWIYTTWGSFLLSYNFIDQMVFEKIFLK